MIVRHCYSHTSLFDQRSTTTSTTLQPRIKPSNRLYEARLLSIRLLRHTFIYSDSKAMRRSGVQVGLEGDVVAVQYALSARLGSAVETRIQCPSSNTNRAFNGSNLFKLVYRVSISLTRTWKLRTHLRQAARVRDESNVHSSLLFEESRHILTPEAVSDCADALNA
jgi:hypothetical protein